ncbi:uncharacterized protein At5g19025-like [Impatiens glandulifera]|uniref:uncharacterized protein At5g19025-like n=1 Tax=Impatiens glandulifera TaxID=253017 RepID=UPI001FB11D37|nr:uncharacterized protein At5g19025-like [Impatiens glandulifera]
MVCFHNVSVDEQINNMSKSSNSSYPCSRLKPSNQLQRKQRSTQSPGCHQSRSAIIDIFILIAVISACTFLLFPYLKILTRTLFQIIPIIVISVKHEISATPLIYGYLGLCVLFVTAAAVLAIPACLDKRCGRPGCKGMRKAAEFDIQLETEDCLKIQVGLTYQPPKVFIHQMFYKFSAFSFSRACSLHNSI